MRMKKIIICGLLAGTVAVLCACSGQAKEKETGSEAVGEAMEDDMEQGTEKALEKEPTAENGAPDEVGSLPLERSREEEGIDFVGIYAHVKEIHDGTLLISSDSDDYPGAFTVTGADEMPEFSDLQGGTAIRILMRKLDGTDEQGLVKYQAERIVISSEDEEEAQADVLLTEAPTLSLQDALSSKMDYTELLPGNYSWNVEDGDEGTGVVACGTAPLEEAAMDFTVRLKVPEYNGVSGAPYVFSTTIAPDNLVIRQWDADDIGNVQAKEERVTKYYFRTPILELEAGKVYEFALEWKKEKAGRNKFYGNASYVLVTE